MHVCVCIDGGGGGGGNGVNDRKNVMLWCGIVERFKKRFSASSRNQSDAGTKLPISSRQTCADEATNPAAASQVHRPQE